MDKNKEPSEDLESKEKKEKTINAKFLQLETLKCPNKHDLDLIFKVDMKFDSYKKLNGVFRDDQNERREFSLKYPDYKSDIPDLCEYKLYRYEMPTKGVVNLQDLVIQTGFKKDLSKIQSVWYNFDNGEFGVVPKNKFFVFKNKKDVSLKFMKSKCVIDFTQMRFSKIQIHVYASEELQISPTISLRTAELSPEDNDEFETTGAIIRTMEFMYDDDNDLILDGDTSTIGYPREFKVNYDGVYPIINCASSIPETTGVSTSSKPTICTTTKNYAQVEIEDTGDLNFLVEN